MEMGRLGLEFGQYVVKVAGELLLGEKPESLSEMERRAREALLEIGRFLLTAWLTAQDAAYPEDSVPCRCGRRAEYRCRRAGVLHTVLGRVEYQRAYYLCPACHQGSCPLDERLGLRPGELSAELESLTGMTGAQLPFEKASALFERLTLVGVSHQSVDKATQAIGGEMIQLEESWIREAHDVAALERQVRQGQRPQRLYGTLDATKVHTDDRRDDQDHGWRDLKIGAWFVTEAKPPQQPDELWEVEARDITYFCDIIEAQKLRPLLWATGYQRGAPVAQEVVFLGDGAEWIWNLVEELFPRAVQIVDWFHATEYLPPVAQAAFADEQEGQAWWLRMRELLWNGHVDQVLAECSALTEHGKGAEAVRKAVTYYSNNRQRMRYADYRSQGYQIGSGTVESGCKQIGAQRMKAPGATWSVEGARRTAKARAALLSGQWDVLTARRERLTCSA